MANHSKTPEMDMTLRACQPALIATLSASPPLRMGWAQRKTCAFWRYPLTVACFLVLLAHPAAGNAQSSPGQPASTPPAVVPVASDQTVTRPSIGLSVTLPVGASASAVEFGGKKTTRIILPNGSGLVNLTDVDLTKPETLAAIADSIISQRLDSVSQMHINPDKSRTKPRSRATTNGKLLRRTATTINQHAAEVFYIRTRNLSGEDTIYGYCLFLPSANTLAMFELQTTLSMIGSAKPYFEFLIHSVQIADLSLTDAQRALGVEAGLSFFESLSPADYTKAINDQGDQWRYERYYKPAATGSDNDATELGYRRTRFALGTRGELKSPNQRGRSDPSDRQKGYLVFQEARILDREYIIDISAAFFMTPDRREESWSIRQSVRPRITTAKAAATNTTETGIRDGDSFTVIQSVDGTPVETIHPLIEGKGYINRVEVYMLARLLLAKEATGTYRFYAYNQSAKRITLRQDILQQSKDTPGLWKYTSRPDEESPGQTAFFNAKHEPMYADLPNGQRWEPITLKRLFKLWKSKNLPLK